MIIWVETRTPHPEVLARQRMPRRNLLQLTFVFFSKRNPSVKVWSNCVSLKAKFQSLKYWLFHWNPKCKVGNSCRLIKTKSSKVDFVFPQNPNVKVGWFVVSSKNKIRTMRSFSTPKNHNWNYVCPHQDKNSGLGMVSSKPSFQNGAYALKPKLASCNYLFFIKTQSSKLEVLVFHKWRLVFYVRS